MEEFGWMSLDGGVWMDSHGTLLNLIAQRVFLIAALCGTICVHNEALTLYTGNPHP